MFELRLEALRAALQSSEAHSGGKKLSANQALSLACEEIQKTQKRQGIVYVLGNGGSAGIASHFANDLIKALHIPSQTLYDPNILTCIANDLGYEQVFAFPLRRLLREEDLCIFISSSGQSQNLLNAQNVVLEKQASQITLTGFRFDNPLRQRSEFNFWVPRSDYGLVEMAHLFLLHTLVDCWEDYLSEGEGAMYAEDVRS